MGIAGSQVAPSWIHSRYVPVEVAHFAEYGNVGVFKKKEENYDYIARLDRAVQVEYLKEIQRELCFLTGKRISLPFLKVFEVVVGDLPLADSLRNSLHGERKKEEKWACSTQKQTKTLSIYIQLLTFTLKGFIEYKKQNKHQITLKEYAYIIKTAISAAQLYEQWRLTYLQMDLISDLFYIRPNGQLKILPFRSSFLRQEVNQCECFSTSAEGGSHIIKRTRSELHSGTYLTLKKKQSKYIRQIKQLSLQLFSTINPNVSHRVRSLPSINRDILVSAEDLDLFKTIQTSIIAAKSLNNMLESLQGIEYDFLPVGRRDESMSQAEINNPETFLITKQLHTVNSFSKEEQRSANMRKIIDFDNISDSMSNTLSNPSPARRESFHHILPDYLSFPYFK